MRPTDYLVIRSRLLNLLGQASAMKSIDPLCADSVEMLEAAKATGAQMHTEVLQLLELMPKIGVIA